MHGREVIEARAAVAAKLAPAMHGRPWVECTPHQRAACFEATHEPEHHAAMVAALAEVRA